MIVQDIIFGEEFMVKNSMGMLSTFPSPRVEAMNRLAAKPVACLFGVCVTLESELSSELPYFST